MRTYLKLREIALFLLLFVAIGVQAQSTRIQGYVKDAVTGEPIAAARVTFGGFQAYPPIATSLTDDDGKYGINAPSASATMLINCEGYQQVEVALKGRTDIDVLLQPETINSLFDDVQLPYDAKRQVKATQAATSLTDRYSLDKDNTVSPEFFLQGRVAGLNVIRRSGSVGAGADMFLRGSSSLLGTSQPLIVVDGVLYPIAPMGQSLFSYYQTSGLANIDTKDIDNITVIKDASSIYGARASNGVILINTLRAQELKTQINFHAYVGVSLEPDEYPMMNAKQFRPYLSDQLLSQGLTSAEIQELPYMNLVKPEETILGVGTQVVTGNADYYRYNHDTKWQDYVYDKAITNAFHLSVTGGDNIAKYALIVGLQNQEGTIRNTSLDKYNLRLNTDVNISDDFTVGTNVSFVYTDRAIANQGMDNEKGAIYTALVKAPFMTTYVRDYRNLQSPTLEGYDMFNASNPYAVINNIDSQMETYRLVANVFANYVFSPAWKAHLRFGVIYDKDREKIFVPQLGVYHAPSTMPIMDVTNETHRKAERLFQTNIDLNATYAKVFNQIHAFDVTFGGRYETNNFEDDIIYRYNTSSDLMVNEKGETLLSAAGGTSASWASLNYYANANYGLRDKYFATLVGSVYGSSRFGENADGLSLFDHKFAFYPSLSLAWIASSENFMRNADAVNLLKFRASYGLVGNDDIGNYASRLTYVSQNYLGLYGVVLGALANDKLMAEKVVKTNFGVDLTMFNQRLTLSADVYNSKTQNMLSYAALPSFAGASNYMDNTGEMTNKGYEFAAELRVVNTPDFKFSLAGNIAHNEAEITKYAETDYTDILGATVMTREGDAPGLFYGYKYKGVFKSADNMAADPASFRYEDAGGNMMTPEAGDAIFENVDKTGDANGIQYITEADRTIIGDPNPDFFGSFSTRFSYKRLTLDAMFTYKMGGDVYNALRAKLEGMTGYENQTQAVLNRWRYEGQNTSIPRNAWGDPLGNARFSDRWIEDGSYLRLKTITLSYTLPATIKYIRNAEVYVQANNLVTWTEYKGLDPEFSISSSPLYQGIDAGLFPNAQSIFLGIKLGL